MSIARSNTEYHTYAIMTWTTQRLCPSVLPQQLRRAPAALRWHPPMTRQRQPLPRLPASTPPPRHRAPSAACQSALPSVGATVGPRGYWTEGGAAPPLTQSPGRYRRPSKGSRAQRLPLPLLLLLLPLLQSHPAVSPPRTQSSIRTAPPWLHWQLRMLRQGCRAASRPLTGAGTMQRGVPAWRATAGRCA